MSFWDTLFGQSDVSGAVRDQTRANRPDQSTPFGFSRWTEGPNGTWSQQTGFSGPLANANESLQNRWAQNAAQGYGNGWDAFNKAWEAEQGLLNPLWSQRENAARSQLANQGADIGDPIQQQGMQQFNDARSRADMQAVQGAFSAQGQMFDQNRQAWMDPLMAMQGMQGLLQQPDFAQATGYGEAAQQDFSNRSNALTGLIGGAGAVGSALATGGLSAPFSFGSPGMSAAPSSLQLPFSATLGGNGPMALTPPPLNYGSPFSFGP